MGNPTSVNKPFDSQQRGYGAIGKLASKEAMLANAVNNSTGSGNCRVDVTRGGINVHSDVLWWYKFPFWYKQSGANGQLITIRAGDVEIELIGGFEVAEDTVTLTGNPEWVYVKHAWGTEAGSIEHASTKPRSNGVYMVQRLFEFVPNSDGKYRLEQICHVGDILRSSVPRGGV